MIKNLKDFFNRYLYQFTVGMFFGMAIATSDETGQWLILLGVVVGFFVGGLK